MSDWKLPWDGGCLCGKIRFRMSAPPLLAIACHCTGCQKLTASAFSLSIAVPSDGFAVTQGETAIGALHGQNRHLYCPHCKNWMFTHAHGLDFFVNVRATMLDKHDWYVPFVEVNKAERCLGRRRRQSTVSPPSPISKPIRRSSRPMPAKARARPDRDARATKNPRVAPSRSR